MERDIGFWSAYLLPFCVFIVGFTVLVLGKNRYIVRPPKGSVIPNAFRICWIGIKNKGNLDAAKRQQQQQIDDRPARWDDLFVDEVRRALVACKVFLFYPIYWVVYFQITNNLISQAGEMQLHGIPNDLLSNLDPIVIIIFIPVCDRLLYPALRRARIPFRPVTRIFMGFMVGAAAMAYAAGVQKMIYSAGPCYASPGDCDAALQPDGDYAANDVHVAVQTPAYLLIGLSEIFASITGLEYAFTKAPASMKSFIMAMFLLTNAFGAALSAALAPTAVDPLLLWMYTGIAVATLIGGLLFWTIYRRLNGEEEEMNKLERFGDRARPANEVSTNVHLPHRRRSVDAGRVDDDV